MASLGPDAADLPVTQVLEAVAPPLPSPRRSRRWTPTASPCSAPNSRAPATPPKPCCKRLGIADPAAAAFLRGNAEARAALLGRAGRTVTAEATSENALQKLSARWIPDGDGGFKRLVVEQHRRPASRVAHRDRRR